MTIGKWSPRNLSLRYLLLAALLTPSLTFGATAANAVELKLDSHDIAHVAETEGSMWLQLTPPAGKRLADLTARAYGQPLRVFVNGLSVFKARVRATINSGVIRINRPSPTVRKHLEALRQ